MAFPYAQGETSSFSQGGREKFLFWVLARQKPRPLGGGQHVRSRSQSGNLKGRSRLGKIWGGGNQIEQGRVTPEDPGKGLVRGRARHKPAKI